MKSKKIDVKTILLGVLGIAFVILLVMLVLTKVANNKTVAEMTQTLSDKQWEIDVLNEEITLLGSTTTVYRLKNDVKSGTKCTEDNLESVAVPTSMAGGYTTEVKDVVGKYFLIDVAKGTPITEEMVYERVLKADDRYLDIICDRKPVGFAKGDTVDIRITFPDGQDYLLLDGKMVEDVYGYVVRVLVNEKDILVYTGAEADWCRFYKNGDVGTSVRIYCVHHVQGGLQSASRYYPIADVLPDGETFEGSVLWTALHDKNLEMSGAELEDWTRVDRSKFERALEYYDQYRTVNYVYDVKLRLQDLAEIEFERGCTEDDNIEDLIKKDYPGCIIIKCQEKDMNIVVDMSRGSAAVTEAKKYRDELYLAGAQAYQEREQAMFEAMAEAKAAGIEFDPNTWKYDYAIYKEKMDEKEQQSVEADGSIQ